MKLKQRNIMVFLALCATLACAYAMAGENGSGADRERVLAVAALEPVGATTGWGHLRVSDTIRGDSVIRMASVCVFDVEPEAELTVVIDDVVLTTIITDDSGDGQVRLGSRGTILPSVPDELPPATDLHEAFVLDGSLAPVLSGEIVIRSHGSPGPTRLIHLERIRLEPTVPGVGIGMARVARTYDDVQSFSTGAGRLQPETSYSVVVDGYPAAVVATDAVGHARVILSTDDDESPLPPELQPIEDLRLVEWRDGDGEVFLSGALTGENQIGHGHGGGGGNGGGGNGSGGGNGGGNGGGGQP
jgi:hypothetical protein